MGYYGVTERGNFEGANILNVPRPPDRIREPAGRERGRSVRSRPARPRRDLLDVRERRIHPLLDDKVLTSWNGLMLRSFAESGAALGRPDYLDAARRNADFLLATMRDDPNGRLLRTWRNGEAKLNGYLEDYACLADGLLSLHEATLEPRWLQEAVDLADGMNALFWDDAVGGFLRHRQRPRGTLVIRPRDVFDNAQPCGGSVAADVLLRLGVITGNDDYCGQRARLRSGPCSSFSAALPQPPAIGWALSTSTSRCPGRSSSSALRATRPPLRNAGRGEPTVHAQPRAGGNSRIPPTRR